MPKPSSSPPRALRLFASLGAALVLAFIGAAFFGDGGVTRHEKLRVELRELQAMNAELAADNDRLEREVEALETDERYIEAVARDELGWVAPNDVVLIFDDADDAR